MTNSDTAKWYAAIVGVTLVAVGLLGFIENPIVGEVEDNPLFVTDAVHNVVHLVTGALALYIAFGLRGIQRAYGLIGYGVLYGVVLLATLLDPRMFGLLQEPVNTADHVLHLALAGASILVGWMAMRETEERGVRRTS